MMLAGPTGTNLVFWSDSGGSTAVSGLNVTLSDMAASSIPSPVASGTFLPTAVNGPPAIAFPAPAPQPVAFAQPSGSSTLASQFKEINANGTWAFYIFDNQAGSGGSIGSVCLNFSQVAPVLSISKSHSGNFVQGQTGSYTIHVANSGPGPTAGTVTVTEMPDTGITLAGLTGNNWTCSTATKTCTRSDALAQGASYDDISVTVQVAADASSPQVNHASVAGGGAASVVTASDSTIIAPAPVLSVTKTHSGQFKQGQTGTWAIAVENSGPAGSSTAGTVTATDTLPANYTLNSFTGTNWFCSGTSVVTCTSSQAVAGGGTFPALSLVANIPANSPVSVTNSVTASGGGALNPASASDSVSIVQTAASVAVQAGSGQSAPINSAFPNPLQAIVQDAGGAAVAGVDVTFTAPGTGASGTFAGGTTVIAMTNASGIATAATFTANGTPGGPYSVNATVAGVGTPASFLLTNTGPAPAPDLAIIKSHTGHFSQGQTGAIYTIAVSNVGTAVTTGMVTVADTLPTGLAGISIAGSGWGCDLATLSCTRSDALAAGNGYPTITLTVDVAANAPGVVTNRASVSGGGESNTSNDTAQDDTTVNPIVDVSGAVNVTTSGYLFSRATRTFTGTITVTNKTGTPISGPLQLVLETVTPGVTVANATGLRNGNPYFTVPGTVSLAPGQSASVSVQFNNPQNLFINFTPITEAGVF
jgi:uncharacterized repeat protein (TIGR01451 family)